MQKNKNGAVRTAAYTLLNNPERMFVNVPRFVTRTQGIKVEFDVRPAVRPTARVVPNLSTR